MFEVVCTFLWGEGFEDFADGVADAVDGASLGLSQGPFQFREAGLDRIEIGGVFGKKVRRAPTFRIA